MRWAICAASGQRAFRPPAHFLRAANATDQNRQPFAGRRLLLAEEGGGRRITVQLGPIRHHAQDASCQYRIVGFGPDVTREIWGLDSIQAIQLALTAIGSDLDARGAGGGYCIEGDTDGEPGHGFPTVAPSTGT